MPKSSAHARSMTSASCNGGELTTIVGGGFSCDRTNTELLSTALPEMLHVTRDCTRGLPHIAHLVDMIDAESRAPTAGSDGVIRVWDLVSQEQTAKLTGHEDVVVDVAYSPDGRLISSASRDKTVRVWDVSAEQERFVLRAARNWYTSVGFSSDGKTIVTGDGDNAANALH